MDPIRTILFPTDQSEMSSFAFRAASALARELGARLVILEVVPPAVTIYGPPSESYLERMQLALDLLQVDDPSICVERRIAEGNPAAEIVRAAEETNCDLIVMATHGRTGMKRFVLGSVAEAVVRRARCPVLLVKTPVTCQSPSGTGHSLEIGAAFEKEGAVIGLTRQTSRTAEALSETAT